MLPFIGRPRKTKTRTQSSEHGVVATGEDRHHSSSQSIERHVWFLSGPEAMKQYGQLAGNSHHGLALSLLAASCSQVEAPLSERRVLPLGSKDMVGTLDQQTSKISITCVRDAELGIMVA